MAELGAYPSYSPHPDATPEGEVAALANVYSFVLHGGSPRSAEEKKKAAAECDQHRDGDDGTEIKGD